jgi:hypothetical protein
MAQKQIVKRKPSPELDQRFTNIESKFQATIENNMNNFDRINKNKW